MDLTKDRQKLKELYQPGTQEFTIVDVPELPFAVIDGDGSPDSDVCAQAIKNIYTAIYPIRREARQRMGKSFVEPPVEIVYWADDMRDLALGNKEKWKWKVMVTLPIWANGEMLSRSVADAEEKTQKKLGNLRMETFREGQCAQIMSVGAPEEIPGLLERLYTRFLPENHLKPTGAYHEIYLDDWSRTGPERRKVILRQPVRACRHLSHRSTQTSRRPARNVEASLSKRVAMAR